ncbi:carboxylating nicotinate-nucleotide diphosphorylase [uncultured Alsobacter sp.]|uniref:carboxylating nicotinate-nucleotide diphosphorylase n=1 Tax=uncultured Alsobacter sp. TaxID=1748258 RepID=UPI0025FB0459|nr:carboxylating nicotinate-nucleotide diphosphorylase [uncultured Alsobacter sp.]
MTHHKTPEQATVPANPALFLNPLIIADAVRRALDEDLGRAGDITTLATIPARARAVAVIAARQPGIVSGLPVAVAAFHAYDPEVTLTSKLADGDPLSPGEVVARIEGPARSVLSAERVALNFMGRMSGIATLTSTFVKRVAGTRARIVCTRKTTPGMRAFEKYAVRCGGGFNHRFGLDDAVLIKDNHIAVAGGVAQALRAAKAAVGHLVKVEIEVDTLDQLDEVIAEGADVVLLDNMGPDLLAEAVRRIAGRMATEASGGINLDTVRAAAESGVDMISVGALTHSAPVLDLGLDIAID